MPRSDKDVLDDLSETPRLGIIHFPGSRRRISRDCIFDAVQVTSVQETNTVIARRKNLGSLGSPRF